MQVDVFGNVIKFTNDDTSETPSAQTLKYTMPDGYSVANMSAQGVTIYTPEGEIQLKTTTFPIVDGKSPNVFLITVAANASGFIAINEFGGIPDPNYFSDTFEPVILNVDGTEKNMIPSTQWKR